MAIDPNKLPAKAPDRAALVKYSTAKLVQYALNLEIAQDSIPDDKNELISLVMKADRAFRLTQEAPDNSEAKIPAPPTSADIDAAKAAAFEAALAEGKAARKDGEAEVSKGGNLSNGVDTSTAKPLTEQQVKSMDDDLKQSMLIAGMGMAIHSLQKRVSDLEKCGGVVAARDGTLHGHIDDLKHG